MSSFNSIQDIATRLKSLGEQLTNSKLSQEELDEFETLSRNLYERAVVLSYKAKEENVFKKRLSVSKEDTKKEKDSHDKVSSENVNIATEIPKKNIQENNNDENNKNSSDGVKLSVKREPASFQLDFSNAFNLPEKKVEVPKINTRPEKESKDSEINQDETKEPVKIVEADEIKSVKNTAENSLPENEQYFYRRFIDIHQNAIKDKLSNSKIISLKGAFGLNDKLLFIRELFDGNSDLFNQTISILDELESYEAVCHKLSRIAIEKNWDKDSRSVYDFAHIVIRRYVA